MTFPRCASRAWLAFLGIVVAMLAGMVLSDPERSHDSMLTPAAAALHHLASDMAEASSLGAAVAGTDHLSTHHDEVMTGRWPGFLQSVVTPAAFAAVVADCMVVTNGELRVSSVGSGTRPAAPSLAELCLSRT